MLWLMCLGVTPATGTGFVNPWDDSRVVGTTVKDAKMIPVNLVADEKHSWLVGERVYIPTTVAAGCFLGVDIVEQAGTKALVEGYKSFQTEAVALNPNYRPETVNTDGWEHTQAARHSLFPNVQLILCFR